MKTQTVLLAVVLLAGCSQSRNSVASAQSPGAEGMQKMTDAKPMPMSNDAKATQAPGAGTAASATGTIQAVDTDSGKITIAHGPVAALKWPAMTMSFKATPEQLAAVKAGQKVDFEFVSAGMDATLTRITPAK